MRHELRHTSYLHPKRDFASKVQWQRYAEWLRRHARVSLALLPEPPRTPLRPQFLGRWEDNGYICEKIAFESMPGFLVTGNLFRPSRQNRRRGRAPAILCPHGHWPDGRLHDRDPRGSIIARCVHLARMGASVFSYDMVGYNDSCQLDHRGDWAEPLWGLSHMALQTWNSIRSLDFLLTLPGLDARRIGVSGASGGGTQTFVLMAVDERIEAAAPIVMVSYSFQGGCVCENAPLLRIDATNVELVRLHAPRPVFLGSCTKDWTARTPKLELPAARELWRLYGAANRVSGFHVDDEHNYNQEMREAVYGFFNRWLFGARSDAPLREDEEFVRPSHRDRMVWWGRPAPSAMSAAELRGLWIRQRTAALRPHLKSAAAARKTLGPLLPHVLGITLSSVAEYSKRDPQYLHLRSEGDALIVAPRLSAIAGADKTEFFSTYNRTLTAECVHEILGALERSGCRKLVGTRGAGMAALLAAAVSERVRSVDADLAGFDPTNDASWRKHCDLPSIRQIGALATVFACIGGRSIELRHASEAVRQLARKYACA